MWIRHNDDEIWYEKAIALALIEHQDYPEQPIYQSLVYIGTADYEAGSGALDIEAAMQANQCITYSEQDLSMCR